MVRHHDCNRRSRHFKRLDLSHIQAGEAIKNTVKNGKFYLSQSFFPCFTISLVVSSSNRALFVQDRSSLREKYVHQSCTNTGHSAKCYNSLISKLQSFIRSGFKHVYFNILNVQTNRIDG